MTKKLLILLLFVAFCWVAKAQPQRVQAAPYMMEMEQPDGYILRTYLRGDERKHWRITEDGFLILKKENGFYYFATENCSGKIVPSRHKAQNRENRTACVKQFLQRQANNNKLFFNTKP